MKPIAQMPAISFDETILDHARLLKAPEVDLVPFFAEISAGLATLKGNFPSEID